MADRPIVLGNTVLEGPVRDQAELQGLRLRVSEFGPTLLSAAAIREEAGKEIWT